MDVETLVIQIILCLCGIVIHFAKQMYQFKGQMQNVTVLSYWTQHKFQSIISLIGSFALFLICWRTGNMNDATALFCGYAGNSIIESVMKARTNSLAANLGK